MKPLIILLACALATTACSDDNAEQTIGGQPWTFVSGMAKSGSIFRIELANYEEEDPCSINAYRELPTIWWFAEEETGKKELGLGQTVVFQVADDDDDTIGTSKNVTEGYYTIDTLGPDTVSGTLVASGFGDSVDFAWEVPLCK